jgi:hypothetical protein
MSGNFKGDLIDIEKAKILQSIGNVYSAMGDYKKGLEYCFKSLEIKTHVLG